MPPNAPGIPARDYATSCAGCSLAADVLTCSHCEKPCGARVESAILAASCSPPAVINNDAGRLRCSDASDSAADLEAREAAAAEARRAEEKEAREAAIKKQEDERRASTRTFALVLVVMVVAVVVPVLFCF